MANKTKKAGLCPMGQIVRQLDQAAGRFLQNPKYDSPVVRGSQMQSHVPKPKPD